MHGFRPHPLKADTFVAICVIDTDDEWVICLAEGDGHYNWPIGHNVLGRKVGGDKFAKKAVRGISKELDYDDLKEEIGKIFDKDGFQTEWA